MDLQFEMLPCYLIYNPLVTLLIGTFRSLRFTVGWPLKSCTHTGIFPCVSGHPTVKRKPRKVPTKTLHGGAPLIYCYIYKLFASGNTLWLPTVGLNI